MNKRKLIDIGEQENIVECDNPKCDYVMPNETKDPYAPSDHLIDMPCPKCGENLLTEEDYLQHKKMLTAIRRINKWLGWLTYILPQSNRGRVHTMDVKVHKGVHVSDIKHKKVD